MQAQAGLRVQQMLDAADAAVSAAQACYLCWHACGACSADSKRQADVLGTILRPWWPRMHVPGICQSASTMSQGTVV